MERTLKIISLIFIANSTAEKCFKDIFCVPANYDKLLRPNESLVQIEMEIHITEVISINDQDFTTSLMLILEANWEEPRIKSNSTKTIPLELSIRDDIWIPDLYIPNMKNFKTEKILTELAGKYWVVERNNRYEDTNGICMVLQDFTSKEIRFQSAWKV